jgi:RHS repeat-associated protein
VPTAAPTAVPTPVPTLVPTAVPTAVPTLAPTDVPTAVPTAVPTSPPSTSSPTTPPTSAPTPVPTDANVSVPLGALQSALPTAQTNVNDALQYASQHSDELARAVALAQTWVGITNDQPADSVAAAALPGISTGLSGGAQVTSGNKKFEDGSVAIGDPVLITTGAFTTSERDFSYRHGRLDVSIDRNYTSSCETGLSLGKCWSFSYDTRIVMGEKPNAEAEAVALNNYRLKYLNAYGNTMVQYYAYILPSTSIYTEMKRRANIALDSINSIKAYYDSALLNAQQSAWSWYFVPLVTVYVAQVTALESHKQELLDYINSINIALDTQNKLIEISGYVQEFSVLYQKSRKEADLTAVNLTKNAYVLNAAHPGYLRNTGVGTLTLIDEAGTPRMYTLTAEPDYDSAVTYPNGKKNCYPNGSATESSPKENDSIELLPDGSYKRTKKNKTVYIYDFYGQLQSITDANGNSIAFSYSVARELTGFTDSVGRNTVIGRSGGKIDTVTYSTTELPVPIIRQYSYTYNPSGMLAAVTDPENRTVQYNYTGNYITDIIAPDASSRHYDYDASNRVEYVTDEEGKVDQYVYHPEQKYTDYINASGVTERYYYDDKFNTIRIEHADGTSSSSVYDPITNNMTSHTDETGRMTTYGYDDNRNLTFIQSPGGATEYRSYNDQNQLTSSTDKMGNTTNYTYESSNLTRIDSPDGTNVQMQYYPNGKLWKSFDQTGNMTGYAYDQYGNITTVMYPDQSVKSFTCDSLGNIRSYTDQETNTTSFEYDNLNRLKIETDPLGHTKTYVYWPSGDLHTKTDERGNVTTYEYDKRHNPTKVTNAAGEIVKFNYRADGKIDTKILNIFPLMKYTYDNRGRLVSEIYMETLSATSYEYDAAGRNTAIIDPNGNRTTKVYDTAGSVYQIRNPDGTYKQFDYYPDGRLRTFRDETDIQTTYEYDAMGRMTREADGNFRDKGFTYDSRGNMTWVMDRRWNFFSYEYDTMNRMIRANDSYGYNEDIVYDRRGFVTSTTDKLGRTSSIEYDALGRPVKTVDPLLNTKLFTYDAAGNLITAVNERGYATHYEYDPVNRATKTTEPASVEGAQRITSYTYGQHGQHGKVATMTDPLGNVTSYSYDPLGRITTVTDPALGVTQIAYDKNGNRTQVTDAEGRLSVTGYDNLNRVISETNPAGETVGYEYDGAGRVTARTTAGGSRYSYVYDNLGRLSREIGPDNSTTTNTYDGNGNMITSTDPNGVTIDYSYDGLNRLYAKQTPEGTTFYEHDFTGNLIRASDSGSNLEYAYDGLNRLSHTYDHVSGVETGYIYDQAGNKISQATALNGGQPRITTYTYGPDNSLASLTDPDGYTVTYGYDVAGRLTNEAKTNNTASSYTYTATGLLETIKHTNTQTGEIQKAFAYAYDRTGKRLHMAEETGEVTSYTYDLVGRLTHTDYPFASGQAITSFEERLDAGYYYADHQTNSNEYTFNVTDPAFSQLDSQKLKDMLASKSGLARNAFGISTQDAVKWQIDSGNDALPFATQIQVNSNASTKLTQLLSNIGVTSQLHANRQVWQEANTFDLNGNITSKSNGWGRIDYTYDSSDRMLSAGSRTYGYDANGNKEKEIICGTFAQYFYNNENRVVDSVSQIAGITGIYPYNREGCTQYSYDPFGRETYRRYYEKGTFMTLPDGEKESVYNGFGMEPVMELVRSGSGEYQPSAEYTFAGSTLVSRKDLVNGNERFYALDALGSTVAMTTTAGEVIAKYAYSAFGTPRGNTFLGQEDRLFAGKPFDYSMGTYNFGFRRYDPFAARFTTVDPIQSGSNWYAYCAGDPINSVDLWGLCESDLKKVIDARVNINITSLIVGDGIINAYHDPKSTSLSSITVPTYLMVVENTLNGNYSTFEVTRDAHDYKEKVPDFTFNPGPDYNGGYIGKIEMRPDGSGEAIKILNNEGQAATFYSKELGETNVDGALFIHVGGLYYNSKRDENRVAVSTGCFTLNGKDAGNKGNERFISTICSMQQENINAGGNGGININIDPLNN